jgi:tetratricopeptide (TPR) repeat protein
MNILGVFTSIKLEDDILIILFLMITVFMLGIIFLIVRSVLFSRTIEKRLAAKLKNGNYNEVINLANEFMESKSRKNKVDSLFVMYYLAQAYEAVNSLSIALKFYTEASVLASKNKKLYSSIILFMARIYERLNKPREALAHYLILIDRDEFNSEALYDLARIQYKNKNLKKAREYLEKLLSKRPGLIDARFLYGKILFEAGNFQASLKQFDLLQKYDSENIEVSFYKARTLENQRRYTDAIKEFQLLLAKDWEVDEKTNLQKIKEDCQIAIINLYIKVKDFHSGIQYVSGYLSAPSSEETKTELLYLYANLLWNTGEEFTALKNFERVYMMKPDFKDTKIMVDRYKKILPHTYLGKYFTSSEEDFDTACRKLTGKHQFTLQYRHTDYYIYSKGVFYIIFYRHIEPIAFSKLTDIEVILNSYEIRSQNSEIYSISGVQDDAVTHFLLKSSKLIEGDEFIQSIKKVFGKSAQPE